MRKSTMRRVGVSLTAVAVLAGVTGCQSGSDEDGKADKAGKVVGAEKTDKAEADKGSQGSQRGAEKREPAQAITAAYKKTSAAKSAKVVMTLATPAAMDGGGTTKMSGVMGWDPMAMDMVVSTDKKSGVAGQPDKSRVIWLGDVMYIDMGASAKELNGKKWAKLDLMAAAKGAGDAQVMKQMTASMEDMNQDPAQQLALLLNAPKIQHLGPGEVDGAPAEHYKGLLPVEDALKARKSLSAFTPEQREKLLANVKKTGIKGYDFDVWVNRDDYPVKMDVRIDSSEGAMNITAKYSDYGTKAAVQAPPADETVDLMNMLKDLQKQTKGLN
ncbi:hypothetical protein [Streptomyces varsoviensis]|uniref:Lipoprotein n=1 Tax=Streptomyces varsoviensis TaxID=67373 RepID=A0ABR5ISQ4_9ACTN|nr:hypothetical protein [Streptomyces varsoviensis]KOG55383.1 lipoprotein [Streptomyces varsoviensis]